jgi:hypothetical protein
MVNINWKEIKEIQQFFYNKIRTTDEPNLNY